MTSTPNGWPASPVPASIGIIVVSVPTTKEIIRLKGTVAPLLLYFMRRFDAEVEPLEASPVDPSPLDEWGYNYRVNKNNPAVLSEHSAGVAIDANATRHPNGSVNTFTVEAHAALHAIYAEVNRVEPVMRWGGDYRNTKDEMHHEVLGQAACTRAIHRLGIRSDGTTAPVPIPIPIPIHQEKQMFMFAYKAPGRVDAVYLTDGVRYYRWLAKADVDRETALGVPMKGTPTYIATMTLDGPTPPAG